MDHDVLIVGGGLTGGALALALARGGLSCALIDSAPEGAPARDGRAYALSHASLRLLRALGLREALEAEAQPIEHVRVADGRPGQGAIGPTLHMDGAEIEERPLGAMVEDRHLRPALAAALAAEPKVLRLHGETVAAQAADGAGARVTLASGRRLSGALIVGADGRTGGTAARAGIPQSRRDYGQTALVATIAHERPHRATAWQLFLPAGPLAILPLKGDRSSIVWTERKAEAARVAALPDEAFLDHLRPRFGSFLGAIALEGPRFAYPLGRVLAQSLTAPRVALLGDAAHGVHPVAGQGLNAGLRDAATLAEVLADARRRGQDPGERIVLDAYARWRRFDVAALAGATDGFARIFSNDAPGLRALRGLGLAAVARSPMLRRALMREAAGLSGDLPRLLRGEPL